jgi:hypothetical protein
MINKDIALNPKGKAWEISNIIDKGKIVILLLNLILFLLYKLIKTIVKKILQT